MGYKTAYRIITACSITILSASYVNAGLVVAVVDSGFDPKYSSAPICSFSAVDTDIHRSHHGTNIADIIKIFAGDKGYCILPFSVMDSSNTNEDYLAVLATLLYMKIDILNLSLSGSSYSEKETKLIKRLLDKGVAIFAAAGNNGDVLDKTNCNVYPACDDPRVVVVGSYGEISNHGTRVNIRLLKDTHCIAGHCMTGTSQATAVETGKYVKFLIEKTK